MSGVSVGLVAIAVAPVVADYDAVADADSVAVADYVAAAVADADADVSDHFVVAAAASAAAADHHVVAAAAAASDTIDVRPTHTMDTMASRNKMLSGRK